MARCKNCGRTLTGDEIGLYRKLVNRGADTYLCKACLADHFSCDTALLDEKIAQFRAMGCILFTAQPPED